MASTFAIAWTTRGKPRRSTLIQSETTVTKCRENKGLDAPALSVITFPLKAYNGPLKAGRGVTLKTIDLMYSTMLAELGQRSLDGAFSTDFPTDGNFVSVPVKGRAYWYFDQPGQKRRYVGPADDEEISRRVSDFQAVKDDLRARRKLVSTLTREAYLPTPERLSGDVVEALANAGLFRLRGVLVGTVAFGCYAGLLGVRLPTASLQTGDADFAQDFAVSAEVLDSIPPILDVLHAVDPSFRAIPHPSGKHGSTAFVNKGGYRVEFLTGNRGSDDFTGKPSPMPALGGASAEPLRFLDFLIYEPVRAIVLHGSGVSVLVPAPERYAVHKVIVATRRLTDGHGREKSAKDLMQAGLLFEAMRDTRRSDDLALAWAEAWGRGDAWREALSKGLEMMPERARTISTAALFEGFGRIKEKPENFGFVVY